MKAGRRMEMKFAAPRMAILVPILALVFAVFGAFVGQKILGGGWSGTGSRERLHADPRSQDSGSSDTTLEDLLRRIGAVEEQTRQIQEADRARRNSQSGPEEVTRQLPTEGTLRGRVIKLGDRLEAIDKRLKNQEALVGTTLSDPKDLTLTLALGRISTRLKSIEESLGKLRSPSDGTSGADPENNQEPTAPTESGTSSTGSDGGSN